MIYVYSILSHKYNINLNYQKVYVFQKVLYVKFVRMIVFLHKNSESIKKRANITKYSPNETY